MKSPLKNTEPKRKFKSSYWGTKWKKGTRVLVTNGDNTIGEGRIVSFKDKAKLWAIVKLDKEPTDYLGYFHKKGYALGYKGYCYKFN